MVACFDTVHWPFGLLITLKITFSSSVLCQTVAVSLPQLLHAVRTVSVTGGFGTGVFPWVTWAAPADPSTPPKAASGPLLRVTPLLSELASPANQKGGVRGVLF